MVANDGARQQQANDLRAAACGARVGSVLCAGSVTRDELAALRSAAFVPSYIIGAYVGRRTGAMSVGGRDRDAACGMTAPCWREQ